VTEASIELTNHPTKARRDRNHWYRWQIPERSRRADGRMGHEERELKTTPTPSPPLNST